MKKLSKIVSVVLSLALCLGMASPAFAASFSELQGAIDTGVSVEHEHYAEGATGADRYKIEAYKDEENGTVNVKLWEKVERDEEDTGISISGDGKDVTIDLNGKDIDGNQQFGSVISVSNEGKLTIKDSKATTDEENKYVSGKITGSNGGTSGGVTVGKDSSLIMESGAISGNAAKNGNNAAWGGGVYVNGGSFEMKGGVIQNNTANPGGNSSGGGVYVKNGSFSMSGGAQILNNAASNGGGIFLDTGSQFSMENSTVSGNHAVHGNGGGISINNKGLEISITGSTISNNTAERSESWGGYGGGISGSGVLTITNSQITNNTANNGGGIHNNESVVLKGTEISGNNANYVGGGIYSGGQFTIESGSISGNTATNLGGGVFNPGHLDVNGGSITGNQAKAGGGIYNQKNQWAIGELTVSPDANVSGNCVVDETGTYSHLGHTPGAVIQENEVSATCTQNGSYDLATYCSVCREELSRTPRTIPATGHTPGEAARDNVVEAQPGVEGSYDLVVRCTVCGDLISSEHVTIPALPVPPVPDNGGADTAPDASTIEDQEVPLAGLTPLHMLLEELRQYEKVEDVELPEDFKWLDHEYAQAIYWGLQEELVADAEEEPLDPDEVITVALLREVLTNFVEYKGADLAVTLEGEDDEIVFDLGERLTAFYAELEASLEAQETKAA